MGKWAKSHKPSSKRLNPFKAAKQSWGALKDDMTPDMPGETSEEKALRNRQAMELSKLDEEENRRIKSMFAGGGGRKLFRSARSSAGSRGAKASSGASASSGGGSYSIGSYGGVTRSGGSGSTSVLP